MGSRKKPYPGPGPRVKTVSDPGSGSAKFLQKKLGRIWSVLTANVNCVTFSALATGTQDQISGQLPPRSSFWEFIAEARDGTCSVPAQMVLESAEVSKESIGFTALLGGPCAILRKTVSHCKKMRHDMVFLGGGQREGGLGVGSVFRNHMKRRHTICFTYGSSQFQN